MTSSSFTTWDSYLWQPGGAVLRNLYGERDGAVLAQREYAETAKQQLRIELGLTSIPRTNDAAHLCAIHAALLGNVYEWAGRYRSISLWKDHGSFAAPRDIPRYLADAATIVGEAEWAEMDRDRFAHTIADVFSHVNQAHPFREGNGRASKIFLQHAAEASRFRIDYDPAVSGVSAAMWNRASMLSGPDLGSYAPQPASLVPVFRALAVLRSGVV